MTNCKLTDEQQAALILWVCVCVCLYICKSVCVHWPQICGWMTALFLLPNDVITDHKSTPSYPLIFPLSCSFSASLSFFCSFFLSWYVQITDNWPLHLHLPTFCFSPHKKCTQCINYAEIIIEISTSKRIFHHVKYGMLLITTYVFFYLNR